MLSKPHKFAIRFYGIVEQVSQYLHTHVDIRSVNRSGSSPAAAYLKNFKELRGLFNRKIDENLIKSNSPSSVWCLQIMQQTYSSKQLQGRFVVTDNFYTRHVLGRQIKSFTDGEVKLLGTVRLNSVDTANRSVIKEATSLMKDKPRGSCLLFQTMDVNFSLKTKTESVAENKGYIIFMDRAIVFFYCNDLEDTPNKLIADDDDNML